jgi:TRAP-type C4-dicarboxylate transport system permease small subunit
MVLSCSANLIKYFFFFLNLIFVAAGIGLIYIGGSVMSKTENVNEVTKDISNLNIFWAAVIIVGILVLLISFFGCYGAICKILFLTFFNSNFLNLIFYSLKANHNAL